MKSLVAKERARLMWLSRDLRILVILRDYSWAPSVALTPFWKSTKISFLQATINALGLKGARRRATQKYANKFGRLPPSYYKIGRVTC